MDNNETLREILNEVRRQTQLMETQDQRNFKQLQYLEEMASQGRQTLEMLHTLGAALDHLDTQAVEQNRQTFELLKLINDQNQLIYQQNDLLRVLVCQAQLYTEEGPMSPETSMTSILKTAGESLMRFQSDDMATSQDRPKPKTRAEEFL